MFQKPLKHYLVGQIHTADPNPVIEAAKQKCWNDATYKCEYGRWAGCDTRPCGSNRTSRGVWMSNELVNHKLSKHDSETE